MSASKRGNAAIHVMFYHFHFAIYSNVIIVDENSRNFFFFFWLWCVLHLSDVRSAKVLNTDFYDRYFVVPEQHDKMWNAQNDIESIALSVDLIYIS